MSIFQPPPTYAEVVIVDPENKKSPRFNPIWLKWFLDLSKNLSATGLGTVSSFGFTNANGISGSVANPGTTPNLTLALGAITPTTVTPSGLVDISGASAGQIKFPASQNASANANTLDDYEEGTFTPTMISGASSAGYAYTTHVGNYTKIGNAVSMEVYIQLSAADTTAGAVAVLGLPFTSLNNSNLGFLATYFAGMGAGVGAPLSFVETHSTTVGLLWFAAGASHDLLGTDLTNVSEVGLAGVYYTT